MRDFLLNVSHDNLLNGEPENQEFADFFYTDLSFDIISRLAQEYSNNPKYLEAVVEVLEAFLAILAVELKLKKHNEAFY